MKDDQQFDIKEDVETPQQVIAKLREHIDRIEAVVKEDPTLHIHMMAFFAGVNHTAPTEELKGEETGMFTFVAGCPSCGAMALAEFLTQASVAAGISPYTALHRYTTMVIQKRIDDGEVIELDTSTIPKEVKEVVIAELKSRGANLKVVGPEEATEEVKPLLH